MVCWGISLRGAAPQLMCFAAWVRSLKHNVIGINTLAGEADLGRSCMCRGKFFGSFSDTTCLQAA
eukprot:2686313-Pleurochrysis_carterae.AAC.1